MDSIFISPSRSDSQHLAMFFLLLWCTCTALQFYHVEQVRPDRIIYRSNTPLLPIFAPLEGYIRVEHVGLVTLRSITQHTTPYAWKSVFHDKFYPVVPGLFVGSFPVRSKTIRALVAANVTNVVNLLETYEFEHIQDHYNRVHWNELRVPSPDHLRVRTGDLEAAVQFIKDRRERGESTFVHCNSGKGRTGAVLFAFLLDHYPQKSLLAIQELVLSINPGARKHIYRHHDILRFASRRASRREVDAGFIPLHYTKLGPIPETPDA